MRTSTLKHFTPNYTQYDYTRPQTPGDSFNPIVPGNFVSNDMSQETSESIGYSEKTTPLVREQD